MHGFSPNMSSLPKMAITISSFRISILPRDIKYREVSTSPRWTKVSPGGACVVLNFKDNALFSKKKKQGLSCHHEPIICIKDNHISMKSNKNKILFCTNLKMIPSDFRNKLGGKYLKQPGLAPSKARQLFKRFLLR